MRLLILIALCFAVASASYANRNRFNRLLRNLEQQQGQGYDSQDLYYQQDDQDDEQCYEDDEEDQYPGKQCPRNQDDDQECEYGNCEQDDEDQQDQDQDYYGENQNQHQRRQHQRRQQQQYSQQTGPQSQQKRQQQKRHQCQPKYQLVQELEQPNSKLASKLYKQAKQQNDDKNTVVSPVAVQLALAAIQRGARGNTKRQIQRLIGSRLSQQQQQQAHTALQQALQRQKQQQNGQNQQGKLKTTTTIVVNQKCQAQQKFIQAVKACLNVQVKKCNFQRQPQQCRQQINQLVAQKTNQKLRQVVPQDAITTNTKMIVVNTAQLKARWGQQFRQQQQTKQGRFYPLGCQQPKPVQVLQSQGQFSYHEDEQLQVVGIPTQRQELTLYVIVPKDKDGLNEIEKHQIQNGQQLKQLLEQADQQKEQIDIELPKFQIKHKIDAKQTLQKQGVQDLCDADQADLSGINGQQGQQQRRRQQQSDDSEDEYQQGQYEQDDQQGQQLHLNKLIHQATIKIDEQGISAARPGQQQRYEQDQDQDEYQQQGDEDDEDQQDQYEEQQLSRQDTYENIFGQRRGQRQNRRQQRGQQGGRKVKVNRAFAFAVKHNPTNQIVMVGRVVDATQKPKNQQGGRQQGQSLNGVDQQ